MNPPGYSWIEEPRGQSPLGSARSRVGSRPVVSMLETTLGLIVLLWDYGCRELPRLTDLQGNPAAVLSTCSDFNAAGIIA